MVKTSKHKPSSSSKHKKTKKGAHTTHIKLPIYKKTQFKYNELPCGTQIIQVHNDDVKYLSVECIINIGSAMEPRDKMGISHLIEHLVFNRTQHFKTQQELKEFLQVDSIYNNAYTSNTELNFYFSGPSKIENLNKMLYVLKEMMLTCQFYESGFEIERNIVIQELNRNKDNPCRHKWDLIEQDYFSNHPLGVLTIGTPDTLNSITLDDIKSYFKKVYNPANFTIYISGNIPEFDSNKPAGLCDYYLMRRGETLWTPHKGFEKPYNSTKHIAGLTSIPEINNKLLDIRNKSKVFMQHISKTSREIIHFQRDGMFQTHIVFMFPIGGLYNPERHLTETVSSILRDGGKGKLYNTIREKYGLSYSVSVYTNEYAEGGYLYIAIAVNKADTDRAIKIMKDLLGAAQRNNFITPEELKLFKEETNSNMEAKKKTSALCSYVYYIKSFYKIQDIEQNYQLYLDIKLDDLNKHAASLLDLSKALIYTYGDK